MTDRFREPTRAEERKSEAYADFAESNWDVAFRKASERLRRDPSEAEVEEELIALYTAAVSAAEAFYESLETPMSEVRRKADLPAIIVRLEESKKRKFQQFCFDNRTTVQKFLTTIIEKIIQKSERIPHEKISYPLTVILSACGAESPLQQNTVAQNLPGPQGSAGGTCELPKINGWCAENMYWKPANGGCQSKLPHDPAKPNEFMVVSEPVEIQTITGVSCSILNQRGYTDWQHIQQVAYDPNPIFMNRLWDSKFQIELFQKPEWIAGVMWIGAHLDESEYNFLQVINGTQIYWSHFNTNPNPIQAQFPAGTKHYLLCKRVITE